MKRKRRNAYVHQPYFTAGNAVQRYLVRFPFYPKMKGMIVNGTTENQAAERTIKLMKEAHKVAGGYMVPFELIYLGND